MTTEQTRTNGWQPIETAPRDGTEVILAIHDGGNTANKRHLALAVWCTEHTGDGEWLRDIRDPCSGTWPPTHWMPAPELP